MPHGNILPDCIHEFRMYKSQCDKALAAFSDERFFHRPGTAVNPVALIVKHLAGNLASRWTDFLTTDGEKPWRDRDSEFTLTAADSRSTLMASWERGWDILLGTLEGLTEADLSETVTIRGEPQTARQAILRAMGHASYHAGQILYLSRLLEPHSPWLTVAPGQSKAFAAAYRKPR